jgi:hypothetical protein
MLRLRPRVLGGLLFTAALVVSGGAAHAAAPEDALMPLEKYTTSKGKSLASAHRARLLQFSEQIYNCLPWLSVHPGGLGFPRARESQDDDRYLSTWIFVDQREDPVFAALPQERRVSAMFSRYGVDMLRRMTGLSDVVDDGDRDVRAVHRQGHPARVPGQAGVGRGVHQPGQVHALRRPGPGGARADRGLGRLLQLHLQGHQLRAPEGVLVPLS